MLFTPHLFSYKDEKGLTLEVDASNLAEVMNTYADVCYLAAINAWELDGKGTVEDFPYTRGDFHEYAAADPKAFGQDVTFAVQALTGKTVKELVEKATTEAAKGDAEDAKGDGVKKKSSRWIGRLLKRSS